MPVTDVQKDTENRTITITAEFAAPVERVWQVYADPRQLERVWGPPTYPATFVDHDLKPGSRITYYMTSPEGEKFAGYWDIDAVDEPRGFDFRDGFADLDFNPIESMPVSANEYRFEVTESGTRGGVPQRLPVGRGSPAGARHGTGRGSPVGDQPDRRAPRHLSGPPFDGLKDPRSNLSRSRLEEPDRRITAGTTMARSPRPSTSSASLPPGGRQRPQPGRQADREPVRLQEHRRQAQVARRGRHRDHRQRRRARTRDP